MSDIANFEVRDPFADTGEDGDVATGTGGNVHIRVQQRNGRKSITTIQGLPADLDLKRILKELKKAYSCNGSISEEKELGTVVTLQGDQRSNVEAFLLREQIVPKDRLKIHGF